MINPVVSRAYAEEYSTAQLRQMRRDALEVHQSSGVVTRSYEGSSMTISQDNAEQILENVSAALAIQGIASEGDEGLLLQSIGRTLDFGGRQIR